jgi:hypothetical protein
MPEIILRHGMDARRASDSIYAQPDYLIRIEPGEVVPGS